MDVNAGARYSPKIFVKVEIRTVALRPTVDLVFCVVARFKKTNCKSF